MSFRKTRHILSTNVYHNTKSTTERRREVVDGAPRAAGARQQLGAGRSDARCERASDARSPAVESCVGERARVETERCGVRVAEYVRFMPGRGIVGPDTPAPPFELGPVTLTPEGVQRNTDKCFQSCPFKAVSSGIVGGACCGLRQPARGRRAGSTARARRHWLSLWHIFWRQCGQFGASESRRAQEEQLAARQGGRARCAQAWPAHGPRLCYGRWHLCGKRMHCRKGARQNRCVERALRVRKFGW